MNKKQYKKVHFSFIPHPPTHTLPLPRKKGLGEKGIRKCDRGGLPDPTFSGDSFLHRAKRALLTALSGLRGERVLSSPPFPSCRLAFRGKARGGGPCVRGAGEAWRALGGGAGLGHGLVRKVNVDPGRLRKPQASRA